MTKRLVCFVFFAVLYGVIFRNYLSSDSVLLTTDAAIRGSNVSFIEVIHRIAPHWNDNRLLGAPLGSGLSAASLLKGIMPSVAWNNHVYGIAVLLSCGALVWFLRKRGLGWFAASCASMAAFWLGTNFTLLYAGHDLKPYVVFFFALSLIPTAAAASGSLSHALLWGGCVGLMFVQQPDVALFFALFAGAYLVYSIWHQHRLKPLAWLKVLVPAAVVAFMFAAEPLLSGYEHHVKGTVQMETVNKKQKWDYVTQWSIPPSEVIDLAAPGYYGWRSGEAEGPYWGRTGRSPGWGKTEQGFRNFKLESTYIGIIPIGFAFFALFACRRSKHKAEILFWTGATVVSLLLAFGKYFPLYSLFYKLPVVNSIRNPNKFIQVFQICIAILSAYGLDILWSRSGSDKPEEEQEKPIRSFFWFSVGGLVLLSLWALIATLGKEGGADRFVAEGWPQQAAQTIVQNRAASLWHAVFMAAVVTAGFAIFSFKRFAPLARYRNGIAALVVLVLAVDAVKLAKHYIKEMPRSYIQANALTDFLKTNLGEQRIAFLSQNGIDNIWITYLMPYNRITCFNFTDMPRMANDYKDFLSQGQRNPLNMFRLASVKYLLAPSAMEKQLTAAECRKVFAYGLADAGQGEFKVVPNANGPFAVYELLDTLPRFALFAGSRRASGQEMLQSALSDLTRVYIPRDSSLSVLDETGQVGTVVVRSYRSGKVRLKVAAADPVILRVSDKYDSDWKVLVDGAPTEMHCVDYLFQGVAISPGEHEVVLRYDPGRFYFYMQGCGILVCATALGIELKRRKHSNAGGADLAT